MSLTFDPSALAALPESPRGPHLFSLLLWIWVRPRAALTAVRDGRRWLLLVPLLFALVLYAGRGLVEAPLQAAQNQQRQIEQMRQSMPLQEFENLPPEAFTPQTPALAFTLLGALGSLLVAWVVRPAVLHVLGLALGGQNSFGGLFSTTAWASFPLILRALVQTLYMATTQSPIVGAGLSGLAAPADPLSSAAPSFLASLLTTVDLFALWYVILLGIAVAVCGRFSRGKAVTVTVVYVVLSVVISALPALLGAAFAGSTF